MSRSISISSRALGRRLWLAFKPEKVNVGIGVRITPTDDICSSAKKIELFDVETGNVIKGVQVVNLEYDCREVIKATATFIVSRVECAQS